MVAVLNKKKKKKKNLFWSISILFIAICVRYYYICSFMFRFFNFNIIVYLHCIYLSFHSGRHEAKCHIPICISRKHGKYPSNIIYEQFRRLLYWQPIILIIRTPFIIFHISCGNMKWEKMNRYADVYLFMWEEIACVGQNSLSLLFWFRILISTFLFSFMPEYFSFQSVFFFCSGRCETCVATIYQVFIFIK